MKGHFFNGAWVPAKDGSTIGDNNYQTLQNLRYEDKHLEGVAGYEILGEFPEVKCSVAIEDGYAYRQLFNDSGSNVLMGKFGMLILATQFYSEAAGAEPQKFRASQFYIEVAAPVGS